MRKLLLFIGILCIGISSEAQKKNKNAILFFYNDQLYKYDILRYIKNNINKYINQKFHLYI